MDRGSKTQPPVVGHLNKLTKQDALTRYNGLLICNNDLFGPLKFTNPLSDELLIRYHGLELVDR